MTRQLWPHQHEAVEAALQAAASGRHRAWWVMPTGTGKTLAFCSLIGRLRPPALVVVHRQELQEQALGTLAQACPGLNAAALPGPGWRGADVVVAMVKSLAARLGDLAPPYFRTVVIDEAHHAPAGSWARVIGHFRPELLLGCTATPERLDGKALAAAFGGPPVYEYALARAIEDGRLVPPRQRLVTPSGAVGLKPGRRDFTRPSLKAVATPALADQVAAAYLERSCGRPAIVFAVNVEHVRQLQAALTKGGVAARSVWGGMPAGERERAVADFRSGRCQALVNCEVLTEGFDERRVGCVVMARPTLSRAPYAQCAGRGLRAWPEGGKADCLVLDVDYQCGQASAVASELFGARVEDCGGQDVRAAVGLAEQGWRLRPLAPTATLRAAWARGEEAPWPELPELRAYAPSGGRGGPATEKQLRRLKADGFEGRRALTRGEADHLIKEAERLDGLHGAAAAAAQRQALSWAGLSPEGKTKRRARRLIAAVRAGA